MISKFKTIYLFTYNIIYSRYIQIVEFMSRPSKKGYNQKFDFSDEQIQEEIKDQIKEIKDKNLKKLEEEEKIYELYKARKQEKKMQKFRESKSEKNTFKITGLKERASSDQQGQIHQKQQKVDLNQVNDLTNEDVLSINKLSEHIRPITLTRNKIVDLINTRRFQELIKGCFVRYLIDTNARSNSNSYIIAQIVGVTEGNKEYTVNGIKTKVLLKLQQTSENVVTLSLQLISNQHPPGGLQIQNWLQTNRSKIPKEKQLKDKLQEHNKLLVEQLSSVEIDSNIWKKAKRIAEQTDQPKEDINPLLDFVSEKLHNLEVNIQEQQIGRNAKGDLSNMQRQMAQVKAVQEKLTSIREAQKKNKTTQKKNEMQKKERKYDLNLMGEKRKDVVNEKCKAKYIMLATYQGCSKLRQAVLQNHTKYNFQIDEDDIEY